MLAEPLRLANGDIGLMELNVQTGDRRRIRFDGSGGWRGELPFAGYGWRIPLANGEFVVAAAGSYCDVFGLDANLRLKWRHSRSFPYAFAQGPYAACGSFAPGVGGRIWFRDSGTNIGSLFNDGSIGPALDVSSLHPSPSQMKATAMTTRPNRTGAVFAVTDTQSADHTAIIAFDSDMQTLWRFEPQRLPDETITITALHTTAKGDVTAIGLSRIGDATTQQLYFARVSASGSMQVTRRYSETQPDRVLVTHRFSDGSTGVLFRNVDSTHGLVSLGASGVVRSAHSESIAMNPQIAPMFFELGDGSHWLIGNRQGGYTDNSIFNLGVGFTWSLDSGGVDDLGIGAHTGSLTRDTGDALVFGSSLQSEAMRFDGQTNSGRVAFTAATVMRDDTYPEVRARLANGDDLVIWRWRQRPSEVALIDANGQTRWRRPLAGQFIAHQLTVESSQIMLFTAQTACVVTSPPGIECFNTDTGASTFTREATPYFYMASGNQIEMLVGGVDGHLHHQRLNMDNELTLDRDMGEAYPQILEPGYALASPMDGSNVVIESRTDATDLQSHTVALDSPLLTNRIVKRMRNGEFIVAGNYDSNDGPVIRIVRTSIAGPPAWSRDIAGYGGLYPNGIVFADEAAVYVDAFDEVNRRHYLHTLNASTGISPSALVNTAGGTAVTYQIDTATRSIGIVSGGNGTVTWRTVFADGSEAVTKSWRCPGDCVVMQTATPVVGNEVLVKVAGVHDDHALTLLSLAEPPRLRQPPFPDDGAITGVFIATNDTNRGYVIDYLPSAHVLFAARFAGEGGDFTTREVLDWETMQGVVSAGANEITVPRYRNSNGRFATIGDAPSVAFGTATFRFDGCDRVELLLRSTDASGEHSETVHLERSGPRLKACHLLDGSTIAAQATRPARGGFDARQSGAWVSASASNQGILAAVLPATATGNGVFFAPWFTYWPETGDNNYSGNRHWFTLQNPILPSSTGSIELVIYRSSAGSHGPVRPSNHVRVGTATWTLQDCEHAVFDYRFDDSELADPFRSRRGQQLYTRPNACNGGP